MRFLTEYQEATGDPRIVPWMLQWYRRAGATIPNDGGWEFQGCHEHLVPLYWLFNRTGDLALLEQARRIVVRENPPPEQWGHGGICFTTLPEGRVPGIDDITMGFLQFPRIKTTTHGVVTAWRIKYPALFYQQQPDERYRQASLEGAARLDQWFGQIAGRFAAHENFPRQETGHNPSHGTEMCNSIEYAYSMEHIFEILGDPAAGDRIESLAYNTWPGQMSADMWCHQYDLQANQVVVSVADRGWDNNAWANIYGLEAHWTCCLANKHHGWPRLVKSLWMATHDNGLLAAVYGPCDVTAKVGPDGQQVTITEETEYPFDGKIRMSVQSDRPVEFPLHFRIPAWAAGAVVRAGGQQQAATAGDHPCARPTMAAGRRGGDRPADATCALKSGSTKLWRSDAGHCISPCASATITASVPGTIRQDGPGKLAARPVREKSGFPVFDWEIYPSTPWNYALVVDRRHPETSISVAHHPIGKIPFAGKGEPVIVKIPDSDAARIERAAFKAEVGHVLPHPAEANLKHNGKSWQLAAGVSQQWVGFERTVSQHEEPIVLKAKARLVPQWKMQPGKKPGKRPDGCRDGRTSTGVSRDYRRTGG